ncbi:MAG TPA: restriction endonuclease [Roseateles sp.]
MRNDGATLENLVSFVEKAMLQQGFELVRNERAYNSDGAQIGEFDLKVKGRVGTTDICWLIECRDRRSDGPQGGAWIEQLVGRRDRFGFNKVTAVSTTGFAAGAMDFAQQKGIELRTVEAMEPEFFAEWLQMPVIHAETRRSTLLHADVGTSTELSDGAVAALLRDLTAVRTDAKLLRARDGTLCSFAEAFLACVTGLDVACEGVEPNGPSRFVQVDASYPEEDRYTLDVPSGIFELAAIYFQGEVRLIREDLPLLSTSEYRRRFRRAAG